MGLGQPDYFLQGIPHLPEPEPLEVINVGPCEVGDPVVPKGQGNPCVDGYLHLPNVASNSLSTTDGSFR